MKSSKMVNEQLTIVDGLILNDDRLVIPTKLQKKAIETVHRSQQDIVKARSLLRVTLWFQG